MLLTSAENAFKSVILAAIQKTSNVRVNVYTGKDTADKQLPCVIVAADGDGEEDPPTTGNFWLTVIISVKALTVSDPTLNDDGQAADPKGADVDIASIVFDAVRDDNIEGLLNATGEQFTAFPQGCFSDAPKSGQDANQTWTDELTLRVYCCGSVLRP